MAEKTGKMLKNIRVALNLDRKFFAEFLGLNWQRYYEYELGRRCMNIKTLRLICDKLDIPSDFLMQRTDHIYSIQRHTFNDVIKKIQLKIDK